MYLKTYGPYLDSFLLIIMNLRIQLELICWALYSTADCTYHRSCLTYIPSPLVDLTVFTHKVPLQLMLFKYIAAAGFIIFNFNKTSNRISTKQDLGTINKRAKLTAYI